MNASLYLELLEKYIPKFKTIIEKINGKRNNAPTYMFKERMRTEYSADQKWET